MLFCQHTETFGQYFFPVCNTYNRENHRISQNRQCRVLQTYEAIFTLSNSINVRTGFSQAHMILMVLKAYNIVQHWLVFFACLQNICFKCQNHILVSAQQSKRRGKQISSHSQERRNCMEKLYGRLIAIGFPLKNQELPQQN